MKTPIRWAGSKKSLLPTLKQHWRDPKARYIEPFCGSACLFFELEPTEAILSDINQELIDAYRALKLQPSRVLECLMRYPLNKATYYKLRAIVPNSLSEVERAARFIFLNRLCFNGIYRTNRQGTFNVPYGEPKYPPRFDESAFFALSALLKRATILNGDFEVVLQEAQRGDFIYLDPPYAVARRRVFSEYHPNTFSGIDIERLKTILHRLQKLGAHFVVSYADCAEGRSLVANWDWKRIRTKRNISGFAAHRRSAYELIASNRELPNGR